MSPFDDQFSDPAIVSGCLSTDFTNSPTSQPHWLKSIQQLTDSDNMTSKLQATGALGHQFQQPPHSGYRSTATHSRMPFAQNTHINQTG